MPKKTFKKAVKPPSPKWDLYKDGLSQSLLSKFIECRETFRLYTVEGLRERGIRRARDYGTIFHKLIELTATGKNVQANILKWANARFTGLNEQQMLELRLDVKIALLQFNEYKTAFKKQYKYIAAEPVFKIPYKLPSGKTVLLRGRMDEVIDGGRGIIIQENKTKQRIDMGFIEDTLRSNLQTMLYALAAEQIYNRPVIGVVYNVIRQPGLRLGAKETEVEYLERIREDIRKRPSHYFQRRIVELRPEHHKHWRTYELNPLLEHVVAWWESIKHNPFDPWHNEDGSVNALHFQRPFGIYSPMSHGRGDYYELKVTGKRSMYDVSENVFEELVDDDV